MVLLNKNAINSVILTLTEKVTINNPYFLFEFTHDQTNTVSYCISTDLSIYPNRYNQFMITEKNNPNALNGEVNLIYTGYYKYKVYAQSSSTNLNPSNANELVEQGKAFINNIASTDSYYGETKYDTNTAYNS